MANPQIEEIQTTSRTSLEKIPKSILTCPNTKAETKLIAPPSGVGVWTIAILNISKIIVDILLFLLGAIVLTIFYKILFKNDK